MTQPQIDVYPVGLLADILRVAKVGRYNVTHPTARLPVRAAAAIASLRRHWRRGSYWNGYLAEPRDLPYGLREIGHGWTKRRALRSLARNVAAIGAEQQ